MKQLQAPHLQLPDREIEFLTKTAVGIVKDSDGTLEDILNRICQVFSDKEYGWEEAILSDKWYMFPSEVENQRFCSEEALKNYLLARTLGLPVKYCIAENWRGEGQFHEFVMMDDNYLDYDQVSKIDSIDNNSLVIDGNKTEFDNLIVLEDDREVLERVHSLRSGESFLDAITCGQDLYKIHFRYGTINAKVKYAPKNRIAEFLFVLNPNSDARSIYYAYSIMPSNGSIEFDEEIGIAPAFLLGERKRIPVLGYSEGSGLEFYPEFLDELEEDDKIGVCIDLVYDFMLRNGEALGVPLQTDDEGNKYLFDDKMYNFLLNLHRKKAEDPDESVSKYSKIVLAHYEALIEYDSVAARSFIDARVFDIDMRSTCGTFKELESYIGEYIGTLTNAYATTSIQRFADFLAIPNVRTCVDKLTEALATKTGVDYSVKPKHSVLKAMEAVREIRE
ncbi:hypothetical protein HOD38_00390 [archaeon]|jgi:hypothetical protein|nr:hypothetical protein [archaeon]MBT4396705.1 hypothetical protein [archaeon]MBT4441315.1 hypothetical protein [archaeon]